MASFAFRLESVLKVRRLREEEAQRVVGRRLTALMQARQRLELLTRTASREAEALRSALRRGAMPLDSVISGRSWIGRLEREQSVVRGIIAAHEQQLVVERARLADAAKQRKALETLRDRQQAAHEQRVSRLEDLFLDEVGLIGFSRATGAGGAA